MLAVTSERGGSHMTSTTAERETRGQGADVQDVPEHDGGERRMHPLLLAALLSRREEANHPLLLAALLSRREEIHPLLLAALARRREERGDEIDPIMLAALA